MNENLQCEDVAIYNLSQHKLTNSEISVLLKSLKFVPDPKQGNAEQRKVDLCNKLKNYEHFSVPQENDLPENNATEMDRVPGSNFPIHLDIKLQLARMEFF